MRKQLAANMNSSSVVRQSWYVVFVMAAGWCVGFPSAVGANDKDDPVNVLFIAVDDMRVELGCYGSEWIHSPNLDALAERSLLFERAYCQQAVCNPSRASLLTGLRIDTLGFYDLQTHFRDKHPDIVTLPQLFKQAGYETHGIGKIFHNFHQPNWMGDAKSWSSPQRFHYGAHGDDLAEVSGRRPVDQQPIARAEMLDVRDDAYLDGRIAKAAVERLRDLQHKPFFLGVGFWKPHLPFNAPAKYWKLYDPSNITAPANPDPPQGAPSIAMHQSRELMRDFDSKLTPDQIKTLRRGYYAAISYVDAQIGVVLDELESLGLREKTIIVFWSDHGFHLGEHDLWCKNSNYELDARVPLMISVPGQPTAGKRTEALAELLDIYPTLADYCGLSPPHKLEGESLRPVVEDSSRRVRAFAMTQNPRPAYRKKGAAADVMGYSVRSEFYRYTQWRDFETRKTIASELYDHRGDPLETVNLIDRAELREVIDEHRLMLSQMGND